MRGPLILVLLTLALPPRLVHAEAFDAAKAFGARPSVSHLTLSPDGQNVAYIAPGDGPGTKVYTINLAKKTSARPVMMADGKPLRIERCDWVSNERLVCNVFGIVRDPTAGLAPVSRVVAVNADGSNTKILSNLINANSRGYLLHGGEVIDWLPDQDGAVLMTREYVPDTHTGSHAGSDKEGYGVDLVDTRNLSIKHVEPARREAVDYISDGRGTVRIMALISKTGDDLNKPGVTYEYRKPGSRDWQKLSDWNDDTREGFLPEAVDPDLNVAYGLKKKDGRLAAYAISLDGSMQEHLVLAHPEVDVGGVIRVGRRHRVIGVWYSTDKTYNDLFAPEFKSLVKALAKALPQQPQVDIVESSVDESVMLIRAGSDTDPGVYYIFDRKTKHLDTFLVVRGELEDAKLAQVKPVSYPAADGTMIPGYLTLPPGHESAHGLPAIVMPHGGPASRDEWGFDWLSQYFASQGFAVLQPNYRGSAGYGDAWFVQNGFRSWDVAIGDVDAGGRWLVSQGIADGNRLAIVGWSYGGYAALQSAVVEPGLFKAVVAIAPVTDLAMLKEEHRGWTNFAVVSAYIGEGPHLHAGSPAEHASQIAAPVLLFHGAYDRNVSIEESKRMAARLTAAGKPCKLVTWDDLDHQLEDSSARAQLLRASSDFLTQALGLTAAATAKTEPAGGPSPE
ncbi:MAG: peptidase prolyl oligopeptidase active site domain protein [Gammaproteobacteria bacterium]|nr:peptidase prolyl oligopeptidase active site domain protein [Gammaproteobacteria bacterium]